MKLIGSFIGADSGYNSLGHRCKELSELDLDNYILFTGCSHTLGEGLAIEQTFPFIVSKYLNTDYYNLGLSGSGIDSLLFNLWQWFNIVKSKPKFLFVQFPDYTRFCSIIDASNNIIPRGNWDPSVKKFIVDGVDNGFLNARKRMAIEQIKSLDIPIITFTHGSTIPYIDNDLRMKHIDYAQDGVHSGIESHKLFASILIEMASDKY